MRWPLTRVFPTKTRHDKRQSQRRASRPQLESLEGRIVQSILFAAYSSGTYAYNTSNGSWREIYSQAPSHMTEGSSGTLFASYSNGVSEYSYASGTWAHLTNYTASELSASRDNTLFATLQGFGTWEYHGGWTQIAKNDANSLAAVGNGQAYVGINDGTWLYYHGGWAEINSAMPFDDLDMSATGDGTLFISFQSETYRFNNVSVTAHGVSGSWEKISGNPASQVDAVSDNSCFATFANGTYLYNGGLHRIASGEADRIGNDGSTMIADLGTGTYIYQNGHLQKIKSDKAFSFA